MAEELIVGGAGEIVNRLISLGFDEIGLLLGVKEELKNLRGVLNSIQAVLKDAEKKQVRNETLRVWLKDLKQVAYDAEDVLDEISYEELRRNIIKNKVYNPFSSSNLLAVRFKIAHKIKDINKRLGAIDKRKNMFQLEPNQNDDSSSSDQMNDRETSSFVDESTVVGRETDKRKIVDVLIRGSSSTDQESVGTNDLSVIPIVGLGGLGKTTLAQLVCNDDVVKKYFDLRVWICVSNNFDTINLFAQILEQILNSTKCESSSKQVLQNNLESQLKGKKFLLVLDDVWNEEQKKWDDLALPLKSFGAVGSKIIVTTRSHTVASIVGAQHTFQLQILSDDGCWTLFERRAFMPGGAEKTSNLVEIGKEIVKKCKGVPLAAKVLGGLMHSKKEEWEWLAVQNGEIWNITSDEDQIQIMKVLKLSYDNLPPTLKSCFSYCAIFPKDHWISRELLIQLWMAQGLLRASSGSKSMEDTGNTYFNILYSTSFFQEAEKNKFGEITHCKMHDLIHDLAQSIRESECQVVGVTNKMEADLSKCRHATLISPTSLEALNEAKEVRTIFCGLGFDLRLVVAQSSTSFNFRLLRVLDFSNSECSEFSPSIGELKHLRYLDLSCTSIKSLPKWVTRLYHLQTLILSSCHNLKELPEDLINLKNLRHLGIDRYAEWKKMPRGMGKLRFLQTLPVLIVCEEDAGRGIVELESLNELRGSLRIYDLRHVNEASSAKRAKLIEKRNMRELILCWSTSIRDDNDVLLLKELQPHSNLKELSIENFGGVEFPRWVLSGLMLPKLVSIAISGCDYCEHIPGFGELPCLEELEIKYMRGVKYIGGTTTATKESRGASQSLLSLYRSLKKIKLSRMENLEEWVEDAVIFPCLEEMSIESCPNLRKTPHLFPSLKSLELDKVGGMGVVSITSSLTSLTSLTIAHCEDLMFLTEGLLQKNDRLDGVRVNRCPNLQAFLPPNHEQNIGEIQEVMEMIGSKSSLRLLEISNCDALTSIPDVRGLTSLQDLTIRSCPELETIPKGFLSFLVALEKLHISGCPKLNYIGGEFSFPTLRYINFFNVHSSMLVEFGKNNKLSSLTRLDIKEIPGLTTLPAELLQSFKHLQHLQIHECNNFQGFLLTTEEGEQVNPCFDTLEIYGCPSMSSIDFRGFVSLRVLYIGGCERLRSLQSLQLLTALEVLSIGKFSQMRYFPLPTDDAESNSLLPSLRKLNIYGWSTLKSLPDQLQHFTTLKSLDIFFFDRLTNLPEWLGNLTLLEHLSMRWCENLMHLPSKEQMQRLTLLKRLNIYSCPNLGKRCDKDRGGPEWPKISHIPRIDIH